MLNGMMFANKEMRKIQRAMKTINYKPKRKQMTYPQAVRHHSLKPFGDIDLDGILNLFDCKPYNPSKQDRRLNILREEELKTLPIFFTGGLGMPGETGRLYPYESKQMSKSAYEAKKRFQSTVKSRPEVIGEIKRKKPKAVLITTRGVESEGYGVAFRQEEEGTFGGKIGGKHVIVLRATAEGRGKRYEKFEKHELASTAVHLSLIHI